jgi:hypothetical protein
MYLYKILFNFHARFRLQLLMGSSHQNDVGSTAPQSGL